MIRTLLRNPCQLRHLNRAIKDVNNKCFREFSILTNCKVNHELLSRLESNVNCIHPYDRRNFIGFVRDKKDDYRTQKEESRKEHIKFGLKQLKTEFKLFKEECKEHFRADLPIVPPSNTFP